MKTAGRRARTAATYVYCVVLARRAPDLAGAPGGLPGAGRPRAVALHPRSSLWLIAADAPLARYGQQAIEQGLRDLEWVGACAAGHERVVEHVAASATVVPMKLFTLFAGDESALEHLRGARARIERIARRVEGCAEWGVRVHVDEQRARSSARQRAAEGLSPAARGTSFLRLKKAERDGVGEAVRAARAQVRLAFTALSGRARDAVQRPPVTREIAARVLLDAVFLVPSAGARAFRSEVKRASAELAKSGCELALTGPWPPYHFVEAAGR
jgi:hypothetical protein